MAVALESDERLLSMHPLLAEQLDLPNEFDQHITVILYHRLFRRCYDWEQSTFDHFYGKFARSYPLRSFQSDYGKRLVQTHLRKYVLAKLLRLRQYLFPTALILWRLKHQFKTRDFDAIVSATIDEDENSWLELVKKCQQFVLEFDGDGRIVKILGSDGVDYAKSSFEKGSQSLDEWRRQCLYTNGLFPLLWSSEALLGERLENDMYELGKNYSLVNSTATVTVQIHETALSFPALPFLLNEQSSTLTSSSNDDECTQSDSEEIESKRRKIDAIARASSPLRSSSGSTEAPSVPSVAREEVIFISESSDELDTFNHGGFQSPVASIAASSPSQHDHSTEAPAPPALTRLGTMSTDNRQSLILDLYDLLVGYGFDLTDSSQVPRLFPNLVGKFDKACGPDVSSLEKSVSIAGPSPSSTSLSFARVEGVSFIDPKPYEPIPALIYSATAVVNYHEPPVLPNLSRSAILSESFQFSTFSASSPLPEDYSVVAENATEAELGYLIEHSESRFDIIECLRNKKAFITPSENVWAQAAREYASASEHLFSTFNRLRLCTETLKDHNKQLDVWRKKENTLLFMDVKLPDPCPILLDDNVQLTLPDVSVVPLVSNSTND